MSDFVSDNVAAVRFIRKLRGGSQPILVEASDRKFYVVKFLNNPQGKNALFNEAMGTELYGACGLPVPKWKKILVTDDFLDRNSSCWIQMPTGPLRPHTGTCFASEFSGFGDMRLLEILPGIRFSSITNLSDFWIARLLDIAACHADNREAIFKGKRAEEWSAVFIDHGHMFSGADGKAVPHPRASTYLDRRIYGKLSSDIRVDLVRVACNVDEHSLWSKALKLPIEWVTDTTIQSFAKCLRTLKDLNAVETIVKLIAGFTIGLEQHGCDDSRRREEGPCAVVRLGIQAAR